MKRFMLISALLVGAFMACPRASASEAWVEEGVITVPAGVGTVTNTPALSASFLEIDRIAFSSELSVTSAVAVAAKDFGLYSQVDTYALAANGGTNDWPVVVDTGPGYTNVVKWTAKDLRFIRTGVTNATDSVIRWRLFGRR